MNPGKLVTLLLVAATMIFISPRSACAAERPNILFILVDDIGLDWLSCYGVENPTPNIDRLAREGVRFETAWATPLCTSTRVEFLTGQYPFRSGWKVHHDVPDRGGLGLDPDRVTTIARVLRDSGYATALCGKWQINDLRTDPGILAKHGFQEHCLWPDGESENPASKSRYWDALLQTNGKRRTHTGKFGPDVVHDYAKDFVARNQSKPFFLYYPMVCCHSPIDATPAQRAAGMRTGKGGKQVLSGMMTYVDHQVGDLMDHLDLLGIADNTMFVFAGDNGSARPGLLNGRSLTTGKKSKGHTFNISVHVPLIFKAPYLIGKPSVSEALTDFTDLFPTFADTAGAELPTGAKLEGRSLVPILSGSSDGSRAWIYSQLGKLRIIRDQRYKLDSNGALFDLQADSLEKNDLRSSSQPEHVEARDRLAKALGTIPDDGPPPFEGYRGAGKKKSKKKNKP